MSNEQDMDAPVTRRELKEELAAFEERLEQRFDDFEQKLEQKLDERFSKMLAELAQHVNAGLEQTRIWFGVIDDKYKDLPPRVTTLEADRTSLTGRVQRLEDAAPKPKRPRRAAR